MSSEEYDDHYSTMEQPWWANDMLILVFTMLNIGIIVYDLQNNLFETDRSLWWILASIDFVLILFFFFDLLEDYSRCNDKKWWYKTHGWEFLGLVPMFLTGFAAFRAGKILRFLRIFRAFSGILRLIGATSRAKQISVERQVAHLFLIVLTLIVAGGFLVYIFEADYYAINCNVEIPAANCNRVISDFGTALWWALVTTTTVGYGDFTPVTIPGRLIAAVLMLVGIGLVGSLAATFSQVFYNTRASYANDSGGDVTQDPLMVLDRLSNRYEKGLISKEEWEAAALLVRRRMMASMKSLHQEMDNSNDLMVPLQVATKMGLDGEMSSLQKGIEDIEARLEEE